MTDTGTLASAKMDFKTFIPLGRAAPLRCVLIPQTMY